MTSSPSSHWHLQPLHLPGLPDTIELTDEGLTFGRDPGNPVVIPADDFPGVSAHHARLVIRDGDVVLEDLDSKNGTYVNGKRVKRHVMMHGEVVELGAKAPPRSACESWCAGSLASSSVRRGCCTRAS